MKRDWVEEASRAHTDLNVFAAVVALLSHSLQTAETYATTQKIIALAEREQDRCLRRFDAARAKAKRN